jgi:hypothetical protein
VLKNQSSSKTLVENKKTISQIPNHLKFDSSKVEATILDYCDRNDISLQLDELLVMNIIHADNRVIIIFIT